MVKADSPPSKLDVPPLENGDRLTRPDFEQRYTAMPQDQKAELIEGSVYMASPVRTSHHARPHAQVLAWLTAYWVATPGTDLGIEPTVRLDADNEPQPDALLRLEPTNGGRSRITADDYIEGAPELIVEIAASSAAYDLYEKKNAYRRNGVKEYLVWRVYDRAVDWFLWEAGAYVDLNADADGISRSRIFPGLWLDRAALLASDMPQVLARLQRGIASPEHQAFVAQLGQSPP
jgi:Uma2 family endonuclease